VKQKRENQNPATSTHPNKSKNRTKLENENPEKPSQHFPSLSSSVAGKQKGREVE